jgi:CDP-diacylglycerol--serine O-phosphatidyltransferase
MDVGQIYRPWSLHIEIYAIFHKTLALFGQFIHTGSNNSNFAIKEMMKFTRHIPNTLTTLNLVCGLVAITLTMKGSYPQASAFILAAALFDFLDGNAARLLKAYSELGKQLDSLADLVSFGVAPGILMFHLLESGCAGSCNALERMHITPYFALLIPVCSALRLAKFNIDLRQEVNFIGLPTPANAIFFASIPLVLWVQPGLFSLIQVHFLESLFSNTRVLTILVVFFSYLLISDFKIFSLKFKHLGWKGNQLRFMLLALSALLLILLSLSAVPLIIMLYVLMSVFFQHLISD